MLSCRWIYLCKMLKLEISHVRFQLHGNLALLPHKVRKSFTLLVSHEEGLQCLKSKQGEAVHLHCWMFLQGAFAPRQKTDKKFWSHTCFLQFPANDAPSSLAFRVAKKYRPRFSFSPFYVSQIFQSEWVGGWMLAGFSFVLKIKTQWENSSGE